MGIELNTRDLSAANVQARTEPASTEIARPSAAGEFSISASPTPREVRGDVVGPNVAMFRTRAEAAQRAGLGHDASVHEMIRAELDDALGVPAPGATFERITRILREDPVLSGLLGRFLPMERQGL